MNEEFEKLFSTLSEKDRKEVANLIRFKNEVKYHDKQFEELLNQYIELSRKYDKLQNNWNELKKSIEEQINICDGCIDTMQSDLQEIAPRGSGKSYMTGEIFKNKVAKRSFGITLDKMQELEQGKDDN